jgi:hypothetical protein
MRGPKGVGLCANMVLGYEDYSLYLGYSLLNGFG